VSPRFRSQSHSYSDATDDEIEIEDFAWDAEKRVYHYPCPCGDRFEISKVQLTLAWLVQEH
jgi:hypothetical protein